MEQNFNILESKEIQDNMVLNSNGEKARKGMLNKIME